MISVYEERGIIKGKRDMLMQLLQYKFGDLPEAVVAKVQSIQKEKELDRLSKRLLKAYSLEEMKLTEN